MVSAAGLASGNRETMQSRERVIFSVIGSFRRSSLIRFCSRLIPAPNSKNQGH
jgi:hypothetical protein